MDVLVHQEAASGVLAVCLLDWGVSAWKGSGNGDGWKICTYEPAVVREPRPMKTTEKR